MAERVARQTLSGELEEGQRSFFLYSILAAAVLHGLVWAVELPDSAERASGGAVAFTVRLAKPEVPVDPFVRPFVPLEAPTLPPEPVEFVAESVEPLPPPEPVELVAESVEPLPPPEPVELVAESVEPLPPPEQVELVTEPVEPLPLPEPVEQEVETVPQEVAAFDLPRPMAKPEEPSRPIEEVLVEEDLPAREPTPALEEQVAAVQSETIIPVPSEERVSTVPSDAVATIVREEEPIDGDSAVAKQEIALITDPVFARPPAPPEYPAVSRRRYEEGTVVFRVLVSSGGESEEVKIWKSSGFNRLDSAAEEAVWKWHFAPAHKAGIPVRSWVEIPVNFYLN